MAGGSPEDISEETGRALHPLVLEAGEDAGGVQIGMDAAEAAYSIAMKDSIGPMDAVKVAADAASEAGAPMSDVLQAAATAAVSFARNDGQPKSVAIMEAA